MAQPTNQTPTKKPASAGIFSGITNAIKSIDTKKLASTAKKVGAGVQQAVAAHEQQKAAQKASSAVNNLNVSKPAPTSTGPLTVTPQKKAPTLTSWTETDKIYDMARRSAEKYQGAQAIDEEPKKPTTWLGKKIESLVGPPKKKGIDPAMIDKMVKTYQPSTPDIADKVVRDTVGYGYDYKQQDPSKMENRKKRALDSLNRRIADEEKRQAMFKTDRGKKTHQEGLQKLYDERAAMQGQTDGLSLSEHFRNTNKEVRKGQLLAKSFAENTTLGTRAVPYMSNLTPTNFGESLTKFVGSVAGNLADIEMGATAVNSVGLGSKIASTANTLSNKLQRFKALRGPEAKATVQGIIDMTMRLPAIFAAEKNAENPDTWEDPKDRSGETIRAAQEGVIFGATMGAGKALGTLGKSTAGKAAIEYASIPGISYLLNRARGMSQEQALEQAATVGITHAIGSFDSSTPPVGFTQKQVIDAKQAVATAGALYEKVLGHPDLVKTLDEVAKADKLGYENIKDYQTDVLNTVATQAKIPAELRGPVEKVAEGIAGVMKAKTGQAIVYDKKDNGNGTSTLVQSANPTNPVLAAVETIRGDVGTEPTTATYDGVRDGESLIVPNDKIVPLSLGGYTVGRSVTVSGSPIKAKIKSFTPDGKAVLDRPTVYGGQGYHGVRYDEKVVDLSQIDSKPSSFDKPPELIESKDFFSPQKRLFTKDGKMVEVVGYDPVSRTIDAQVMYGDGTKNNVRSREKLSTDDIKDLPDNIVYESDAPSESFVRLADGRDGYARFDVDDNGEPTGKGLFVDQKGDVSQIKYDDVDNFVPQKYGMEAETLKRSYQSLLPPVGTFSRQSSSLLDRVKYKDYSGPVLHRPQRSPAPMSHSEKSKLGFLNTAFYKEIDKLEGTTDFIGTYAGDVKKPFSMDRSDFKKLKHSLLTGQESLRDLKAMLKADGYDGIAVTTRGGTAYYPIDHPADLVEHSEYDYQRSPLDVEPSEIGMTKTPDSEKATDLVAETLGSNAKLVEQAKKLDVKSLPETNKVYTAALEVPKTVPLATITLNDLHFGNDKVKEQPRARFARTWKQTLQRFGNLTHKDKRMYEMFGDKFASSSEELGRIHPHLKNDFRNYGRDVVKMKAEGLTTLSGLVEHFGKNKNKMGPFASFMEGMKVGGRIAEEYRTAKDYDDVMDRALRNEDRDTVRKMVGDDVVDATRGYLDHVYEQMKSLGMPIGFRKGYFPRKNKDPKGFVEAYQSKFGDYDKVKAFVDQKYKREATDAEVADFITEFMMSPKGMEGQSLDLGNLKSRVFDKIPDEFVGFYENSFDTLHNYIANVTESIAMVRFLNQGIHGKPEGDGANVSPTVDAYVMAKMAEGLIPPNKAYTVTEILNARFTNPYTNKFLRFYKSASHLTTIGNTISAISQIEDVQNSLYENGLRTIPEYAKMLGREVILKTPVTLAKNIAKGFAKLGIERADQVASKLEDFEGKLEKGWLKNHPDVRDLVGEDLNSVDFTDKATDIVKGVFDSVGLSKMIRLAKQTFINTTHDELTDRAKGTTGLFGGIRKKLGIAKDYDGYAKTLFYGDEARVKQLKEDLKNGIVSDDVKEIIFNKMLDYDPSEKTEVPPAYNRSAAGRCFYAYKTFLIKRIELFRRDVFNEAAKGNVGKSAYNFGRLTLGMLLIGAATDELKDLILGRPTSISDRAIDQLFKMSGLFTKYTKYQFSMALEDEENRASKLFWAIQSMVGPPLGLIQNPADDLSKRYKHQFDANEPDLTVWNAQSTNLIPVGGKFFNRRWGAFSQNIEKKNKKRVQDESVWARTLDELIFNSRRGRARGWTNTERAMVAHVTDGDTVLIRKPGIHPDEEDKKKKYTPKKTKIVDGKEVDLDEKELWKTSRAEGLTYPEILEADRPNSSKIAVMEDFWGQKDALMSIRYQGVDTPESAPGAKKEGHDIGVQFYGHEASAYNKTRAKVGEYIQWRSDVAGDTKAVGSDRYMGYIETLPEYLEFAAKLPYISRAAFKIADITRTTKVINEELVEKGYARYSKGFTMSHASKYLGLTIMSEAKGLGLWDREAYRDYYHNLTGADAASWKEELDYVKEHGGYEKTAYDYMGGMKADKTLRSMEAQDSL